MHFLKRKDLVTAALLTLVFLVLTKAVAYLFISRHILYDEKGITMKAEALAGMLSWPLSVWLPTGFVYSYFFLPIVFVYYLLLVIAIRWLHAFLKNKKIYRWISLAIVVPFILLRAYPGWLVKLDNNRPSKILGTPGNGALVNGKRLLFKGKNFEYFNFLSYLKGNCFVHHAVKQTLLDAYKTCETTCAGIKFYTGEGSKKNGGPYVINHRTHQNGTSIDLLLVFKKGNQQYIPLSLFNAYGYGINTDNKGWINKSMPVNSYPDSTKIDFETNAKFLLALDDACKKNGIKIKIVIIKVELTPLLLSTTSGKELVARHIRFAHSLPPTVNLAHDDHFHVDFGNL